MQNRSGPLEARDVTLIYKSVNNPAVTALSELSAAFAAGERWSILGPSGCGKTTLLLLLAGLLTPTAGSVYLNDRPVNSPQPEVSVILQDYGLFPWKSVLDNTLLGLSLKRKISRSDLNKTRDILDLLGLFDRRHSYPRELSGGQRQRAAIARALVLEPNYLLMDEPLSALDALTREQLLELLLHLWQIFHFTIVFVTHSIEEAVYLGGSLLILSGPPGRVRKILPDEAPSQGAASGSNVFYHRCAEIRTLLRKETAALC